MSTYSNASPFAVALPNNNIFTLVEHSNKRSRSESMDSESTDSRPSKRSRLSTDSDEVNTTTVLSTPRKDGNAVTVVPNAPKKVWEHRDEEEESDIDRTLRDLATEMAESVLRGEDEPLPNLSILRHIGEMSIAHRQSNVQEDNNGRPQNEYNDTTNYKIHITIPGLGDRLTMRHPRVVYHLLRFLDVYNEVANEDEQIEVPPISDAGAFEIMDHPLVTRPDEDSAQDAEDFIHLINKYRCQCFDCEPLSDHGDDDNDSVSSWNTDNEYYRY